MRLSCKVGNKIGAGHLVESEGVQSNAQKIKR